MSGNVYLTLQSSVQTYYFPCTSSYKRPFGVSGLQMSDDILPMVGRLSEKLWSFEDRLWVKRWIASHTLIWCWTVSFKGSYLVFAQTEQNDFMLPMQTSSKSNGMSHECILPQQFNLWYSWLHKTLLLMFLLFLLLFFEREILIRSIITERRFLLDICPMRMYLLTCFGHWEHTKIFSLGLKIIGHKKQNPKVP